MHCHVLKNHFLLHICAYKSVNPWQWNLHVINYMLMHLFKLFIKDGSPIITCLFVVYLSRYFQANVYKLSKRPKWLKPYKVTRIALVTTTPNPVLFRKPCSVIGLTDWKLIIKAGTECGINIDFTAESLFLSFSL